MEALLYCISLKIHSAASELVWKLQVSKLLQQSSHTAQWEPGHSDADDDDDDDGDDDDHDYSKTKLTLILSLFIDVADSQSTGTQR